jgi:energy-coupling factor transporter ATP-binding protein EcfA2
MALSARRSASEVAAATLDQARFSGVGAEAWRAMWEAARIFSTTHAYPSHDFPHVEEALCPLCQQGLGDEAGKRMLSFEAFVTGDVEAKAKAAEGHLRTLLESLPTIPAGEDWVARYSSIPGAEEPARGVHVAFAACLEALGRALVPDEVPVADCRSLIAVLDAQRRTLEPEQNLLLNAQKGSERAKLEAELAHLRMLDWCNDNLPAILVELGRLKKVEALDAAAKRTSTAPLTKKKNELAQAELTGGYQSRFEQELKALGGSRLPVKPMEAGKGAKGRVTFSLAIVGAKKVAAPVDVLSEGEARVVSLAAFLADVTVAGARTPFVFDDPISSLDVEFEERVADRLIALARTRQVLVFTHRLSLVALIREAIRKGNAAAKHVDGQTPLKPREVVLRRLGKRIGLATDTGVHESKVEKALNDVMNRRMVAAKKAEEAGDPDTYADLMQGICSDIRTLAERAVEEELLSGVVVRFRRSVVTKDKLTLLAKINVDDCTFIDDLMTRFSVFEHSQASELPVAIPSYEDVMADAMALKNWVVEFRERVAEAVEA